MAAIEVRASSAAGAMPTAAPVERNRPTGTHARDEHFLKLLPQLFAQLHGPANAFERSVRWSQGVTASGTEHVLL